MDGGTGIVTLEKLAELTGIHERTLRRWMDDPVDPMPTHHIRLTGAGRGRVLVSLSEFHAWASRRPAFRSKATPAKPDMDQRVAAAVKSMRG